MSSSPVRTTFAASSRVLNFDPCHFVSRLFFWGFAVEGGANLLNGFEEVEPQDVVDVVC